MSRSTNPQADALASIDPALRELIEMHTYRRPCGSATEAAFIAKWIDVLPGVYKDDMGNRIGIIGDDPATLWSSHTDTVHRVDGMQTLAVGDNLLTLGTKGDTPSKSNCLGADCTVGVWLMRQMYINKVPGLYIWHHGEEVGGLGSKYIADCTPELLSGINAAVAFDRRGYTSVITHQFGERTASDAFAKSLAAQLSIDWDGSEWELDDAGVFTDTANYSSIIPECTNISVGYTNEHSVREALNLDHAYSLLLQLLDIDDTQFIIMRDPSVIEYGDWAVGKSWFQSNTNPYSSYGDPYEIAERNDLREDPLLALVKNHPQEIVEILTACGFTYEEVRRCVLESVYGDYDKTNSY